MPRKFPNFRSQFELNFEALSRDASGRIAWANVFGVDLPLRIEVGVGNSFFLIEVSQRSPDYNYLGFEYSTKRVRKFLKKVEAAGITNIRMLPIDVLRVLPAEFAASSVDQFYINHPDPWPKRRHAKKRFVRPEVARFLADLLREGGGISLRTDAAAYAEQMLEVLDSTEGLVNAAGTGCFSDGPREPFLTQFERRFLEEGRKIYYLEYVAAREAQEQAARPQT